LSDIHGSFISIPYAVLDNNSLDACFVEA